MSIESASSPILVTGSAGAVGRSVCHALLAAGLAVRGFDRHPMPSGFEAVDQRQGELTDAEAVAGAVHGCERVIHLAAVPDAYVPLPGPLCDANVLGLHHVLEACRMHGVRRVVLTSSVMVAWGLPWQERFVTLAEGARPETHYGLTKLLAEQMGEMYSRLHGMSVVAFRLGWHLRTADDLERTRGKPAHQAIFLSTADAGRAYRLAVEASDARIGGFAVMYITSRSPYPYGFDLREAREILGYEPADTFPEHGLLER